MNIYPVQRYCFRLTGEEINALDIISNVDCSFANNCEGCPLRFKVDDETRCLKNVSAGILARMGVNKDD